MHKIIDYIVDIKYKLIIFAKKSFMLHFWSEPLPDGCPPLDAIACNGKVFRIAKSIPADLSDFFSQRKLKPNAIFKDVDECIARSLSVFDDKDIAAQKLKLPKFRNAHIIEISLTDDDGKMKKTFGPSHHSWWLSKNFDLSKCVLVL